MTAMWSFSVGSLWGIPIRIHVTFPLILVWAAFEWGRGRGWQEAAFGVVLALLLFLCVLLHEMGHSLVARRFHIRVDEILLLPFGGLARLRTPLDSPWQELVVAAAGPLVNVVLGVALYPLYRATASPLVEVMGFSYALNGVGLGPLVAYLFAANLILAAFNLLPAFPMDGGRMVRAVLASVLPYRKATVLAVRGGQAMAVLFGGIALLGQPLLALVALFILVAANAEIERVALRDRLRELLVADFMQRKGRALSVHQRVAVARLLAALHAQYVWPVVERGHLVGLVTRRSLERSKPAARVGDVMDRNYPVFHPHMTLYEAQTLLLHEGREAGAVVENGTLVGLLSAHAFRQVQRNAESP